MSIAPTNFSELAFLSCLTCFSMACLIVSKKAVHEVFNKFSYFMTTFLQTNQTNQAILVISLDYDGTFDRGKEKIPTDFHNNTRPDKKSRRLLIELKKGHNFF